MSPSACPAPLPASHLVTIAASAGGVVALQTVLRALPRDLPAAIVIVQHRTSLRPRPDPLVAVLARATPLVVKEVVEGEIPRDGVVYLAPPDHHVEVTPARTFHVYDGRRIRFVKSSANPLFASAAAAYGADLVAAVLTGWDRDGTDGVQAVAAGGGTVIAQEPESAFVPQMPASAIATGAVSAILPLDAIAPEILRRVHGA